MTTALMPQVKNIVFLMLENRSLDNVLGWLYTGNKPLHVYPAKSSPDYDGLVAGKYSNPYLTEFRGVQHYPVVPVPDGLGSSQDRVPAYDPYEELRDSGGWNGVMNQFFGDQVRVTGLPPTNQAPRMLGFLQDYFADYMADWKGLDSLWCYKPGQLKNINSLAGKFAVSDRWFCSVPSQTNPNRAYSLIGTSQGWESNASISAVQQFKGDTIFNGLVKCNKSWGLYFTDTWQSGLSYTEYTFPGVTAARSGGEVASLDTFFTRASAGTLPDFTYLEPAWGYGKGSWFKQGTDFHPPSHVLPGDNFVGKVFGAVRNGPQWAQTLLIITFDEHGGTYDHVAPPWGAINPDGIMGRESNFGFNLFGARVPTILVSPFVQPSTVFRAPDGSKFPFDHTSFIKTLLLWAGVDLGSVNFGKRMPQAPTFDGVLAAGAVNDGTIEQQDPQLDAPLASAETSAPSVGPGQPLNALLDGVSGAATRVIIHSSASLAEVQEELARYSADPQKYEDSLVAPR
jgi:phospholipase C